MTQSELKEYIKVSTAPRWKYMTNDTLMWHGPTVHIEIDTQRHDTGFVAVRGKITHDVGEHWPDGPAMQRATHAALVKNMRAMIADMTAAVDAMEGRFTPEQSAQ